MITNAKQVTEAIEIIKDSLELNDHAIEGVLGFLVHYLEANVDDIIDVDSDNFDCDEEELF